MAIAKGTALRATLAYIESSAGKATLDEIIGRLPKALRARVESVASTDEIPFRMLLDVWRTADEVMRPLDAAWMEKAGAHSIRSLGSQLYGGIIRKGTPTEFLNQPIKLFRLYYHSGDMHIVEQEPGRAVLRMVDFDEPDPLFCARQTGGLRMTLELAGGNNAVVRHVRCANEGDAFCEWEATWQI
ncbi:MAG: hypothetical protein ACT4O1_10115 [Gemmatimonadota bacterium]